MNSKIKVVCDNCDKEFKKYPCRINTHNFCCFQCYLLWQRNRPKTLYLDEIPRCHRKKRATAKPLIRVSCQQCGKPFIKQPSNPTKFCSHQCASLWLKENDILKKPRGPRHWKSEEQRQTAIRNALKGLRKRPTSLEKQMINLTKKYEMPYKYTGDGSFIIGFKNPDFVNINGDKICIEVANHYHHKDNWAVKRIAHFAKYGWKCYVFFPPEKQRFLDETEIKEWWEEVPKKMKKKGREL